MIQETPAPGTVSTSWQLAREAAERYAEVLVPTIMGPFAQALVDSIEIAEGATVVDVGCGTGAAARCAAACAGKKGRVLGIDINEGMLAVAASLAGQDGASIEWRHSSADRLPLDDASADVVLCAQTLQFLPIRSPAIAQMRRVLKPGGLLGVSTWCRLSDNPYFDALTAAVSTHLGEAAAGGLRAIAMLGKPADLQKVLAEASWQSLAVTTIERELQLPPLAGYIPRHLGASPLAQQFAALAPSAQAALADEVRHRMRAYRRDDDCVVVPFRSIVARGLA